MLKSKVFLKKTKRGGVLKIVREHYLRDDLVCGFPQCEKCDQKESESMDVDDVVVERSSKNPLLMSDHSISLNGKVESHVLIPDTNVVLHQVGSLSLVGKSHYHGRLASAHQGSPWVRSDGYVMNFRLTSWKINM